MFTARYGLGLHDIQFSVSLSVHLYLYLYLYPFISTLRCCSREVPATVCCSNDKMHPGRTAGFADPQSKAF